jgi:hypothetical protein
VRDAASPQNEKVAWVESHPICRKQAPFLDAVRFSGETARQRWTVYRDSENGREKDKRAAFVGEESLFALFRDKLAYFFFFFTTPADP